MKIKLGIYSKDNEYGHRFERGIKKNVDFQVSRFTSEDSLKKALDNNRIDIILYDENLAVINDINLSIIKIFLFENVSDIEDVSINHLYKYQNTEIIGKEIEKIYIEKYPNALSNGNKDTKICAVYSPVGGSGKTTIATSIAYNLSQANNKVLYFNMEQFSSTNVFWSDYSSKNANIHKFFESVVKGDNIISSIKCNISESNNINFFNPSKNIKDILEINGEEINFIKNGIAESGLFDYIIFDLDTRLDKVNKMILSFSDEIYLITVPGEIPYKKINILTQNENFKDDYMNKVTLVLNKFTTGYENYNLQRKVTINNVSNMYKNVIDIAKYISIQNIIKISE